MKRLAIGLVIVLAVVLAGLSVYRAVTFRLVSSFPVNHASNMPTFQAISFNFSQPLDATTGVNVISIYPSVAGTLQVTGKTATFTPNSALTVGTKYSATISNIMNSKGKQLSNITIQFTAVFVPLAKLPKSVQNRYISKQDQQYDAQTPLNRLKNALPYRASTYSLDFNTIDNTFEVTVSSSDVSAAEAAANAFIASFGVNPSSVTIYDIVPAAYSGQPGP